MSALAAILLQRLGDDADVVEARLLHRVHDGGEGAERNVFIGTNEDGLAAGITNFLPQPGSDFVDVNGIIAEKYALILVDGEHQTFFGDLLDGSGLGNGHIDAGLQHRSSHHEDDQQHQNHIHQRGDVDVGDGSLGAPVRSGKGHQRLTSTGACAELCSTAFRTSRAKSSLRAANSRIEAPIRLYAITAGIAAARPAAVVIRASEMPGATARRVAAPAVPSPWNASIIPQTVPNKPTNGVTAAVMASHGRLRSRRVIPS